MISPLITLGLSPEESKLLTWGYGPDAIIQITAVGPGGRRGNVKQREDDRILRIRVTDEDGKKFVQEVVQSDLKNIKIRVSEARVVTGDQIYIYVKEHLTGKKKSITFRVKELYETRQAKKTNR